MFQLAASFRSDADNNPDLYQAHFVSASGGKIKIKTPL
jgi:hypothetical protein